MKERWVRLRRKWELVLWNFATGLEPVVEPLVRFVGVVVVPFVASDL